MRNLIISSIIILLIFSGCKNLKEVATLQVEIAPTNDNEKKSSPVKVPSKVQLKIPSTELKEKEVFKKKIGTIKKSKHEYKFGLPEEKGILVEKTEYDTLGRIEETWSYAEIAISKTKLTYQVNGFIDTRSEFDEKDKLRTKIDYKTDTKGQITEKIKYDAKGKLSGRTEIKYDSNGNEIELIDYTQDGKVGHREETKYNENRVKTEYTTFDLGTVFKWNYSYKSDSNGKVTERISRNDEKNITLKETFGYNANGLLIEECLYDNSGMLQQKTEFKYDEDALLDKEIKYDSLNNPISMISYDYEIYE
jgi:hypothetical protein